MTSAFPVGPPLRKISGSVHVHTLKLNDLTLNAIEHPNIVLFNLLFGHYFDSFLIKRLCLKWTLVEFFLLPNF